MNSAVFLIFCGFLNISLEFFSMALRNFGTASLMSSSIDLEQRKESRNDESRVKLQTSLICNLHEDHLKSTKDDEDMKLILEDYEVFEQEVRDGRLGKTGFCWMWFLDDSFP